MVWNKKTNPFDKIVKTGAPLDDVFTESDEAFLIIAMKNNRKKWFTRFQLEKEKRKTKGVRKSNGEFFDSLALH